MLESLSGRDHLCCLSVGEVRGAKHPWILKRVCDPGFLGALRSSDSIIQGVASGIQLLHWPGLGDFARFYVAQTLGSTGWVKKEKLPPIMA